MNCGTRAVEKYIPDIYAFVGLDIARIRTTAAKMADGKHYLVNGTKKWITGGCLADLFSVAIQTDKIMSITLIEPDDNVFFVF